MEDASGGLLSELEAQLRAPDSVMEPKVLDLLRLYFNAGGYAQMCDVMCQWLEIADVRSGASGAGEAAALGGTRPGSSGGVLPLAVPPPALPTATAAVPDTNSDGSSVPDEFTLLQELALERFQPEYFTKIFTKGTKENALGWLDDLISDRRGRQLIYTLSSMHHNSLLLDWAMHCIVNKGLYDDEVASVGGSLKYFQVQHRVLMRRLEAAACTRSTAELQQITADIIESCVGSQHTYVHAMALLGMVALKPNGGLYRWMAQEVEAAAAARHGAERVYQMQPLFAPADAGPSERHAVLLVSRVLCTCALTLRSEGSGSSGCGCDGAGGAVGSASAPPEAISVAHAAHVVTKLAAAAEQLQQLAGLYCSSNPAGSSDATPVDPLRHPVMMQLLLTGAFAGNPKGVSASASTAAAAVQPPGAAAAVGELCTQLLAVCVAGRSRQQQQQIAREASQGSAPAERHRGRSMSPAPQQHQQLNTSEVARLLKSAAALSRRLTAGTKLSQDDISTADEVCCLRIAAVGLLQHTAALLGDSELCEDERARLVVPNCLALLHSLAGRQPRLVDRVLGALHNALQRLGRARQELSAAVLSLLVSVVLSGAAEQGLAVARGWASSGADPSLVRLFVQLLLDSVSPPYSPAFVRALLPILQSCLVSRLRGSQAAPALRVFADACSDLTFMPPLSQREQELLEELGRL